MDADDLQADRTRAADSVRLEGHLMTGWKKDNHGDRGNGRACRAGNDWLSDGVGLSMDDACSPLIGLWRG